MQKVAAVHWRDDLRIAHEDISTIMPFLPHRGGVLNTDPASVATAAPVTDDERGVIAEPSACDDDWEMTVK